MGDMGEIFNSMRDAKKERAHYRGNRYAAELSAAGDALYVSIHILETQGLITRETATYMSSMVTELQNRIENLIDSVNEMDKTIALLKEQQPQRTRNENV